MIPLRDNIPSRHRPIMNYAIIGLNVLFFFLELATGSHLQEFLTTFGFIPARFFAMAEAHPERIASVVPAAAYYHVFARRLAAFDR